MKKNAVVSAILAVICSVNVFAANLFTADTEASLPTTGTLVSDTVEAAVATETANRGSYGRVIIPPANVDTAVFYTDDFYKLQAITDAEDSAAMFDWDDGNTMIADHNYQGFEGLRTMTIAEEGTYAYITTGTETTAYKCVEKISEGHNRGDCLTYANGTPISVNHTNSLVIYTCNANYAGCTVTITVWEVAENAPAAEINA